MTTKQIERKQAKRKAIRKAKKERKAMRKALFECLLLLATMIIIAIDFALLGM